MEQIGIFLAEGFEEIEALTVTDVLRRADIPVVMISITQSMEVTGSHAISVKADQLLEETDFDCLSMIVLPGGMPGTVNLEKCDLLMEKLDKFYSRGKQIAAICAAPSILGHRGMLKNRLACAYPGYESHLEGAKITENSSETSGNIITGRGMGCSLDFALAIVTKLRGEDKAKALAEKMIYIR